MNISYELAKELEDAGYLQQGDFWYCDDGEVLISSEGWEERTYYRKDCIAPTLSELIEACGKGFSLTDFGNRWKASVSRDGLYWFGEHFTPECATARLWLALNKKGD